MELNPGATNIKYPCGDCARTVKFGPSIACDQCDIWYHQECAGMNRTIFGCYTNTTIDMERKSKLWSPKHIGLIVG